MHIIWVDLKDSRELISINCKSVAIIILTFEGYKNSLQLLSLAWPDHFFLSIFEWVKVFNIKRSGHMRLKQSYIMSGNNLETILSLKNLTKRNVKPLLKENRIVTLVTNKYSIHLCKKYVLLNVVSTMFIKPKALIIFQFILYLKGLDVDLTPILSFTYVSSLWILMNYHAE